MESVASGDTREAGATTLTTVVMGVIALSGYGIGFIALTLVVRVLSTIPDGTVPQL